MIESLNKATEPISSLICHFNFSYAELLLDITLYLKCETPGLITAGLSERQCWFSILDGSQWEYFCSRAPT